MNLRLIRNTGLALAMSAVAVLLPAQRSEAQYCSPACQECLIPYAAAYQECMQTCGGSFGCAEYCYTTYLLEPYAMCAVLP
jgi:hypothetical protein